MGQRPRAVRLGVFAVDDATVQIAWGKLGPGRIEVSVGDDTVEVGAVLSCVEETEADHAVSCVVL